MAVTSFPEALPALSRLHWYVVERVLGQGGFGITYLAKDTNLDQAVAIKEYLPADVATRMSDATIRSRTEDLRDRYRWGLERFIQEARTLARFDHPNIVHVKSVFEYNNTAYMVMRFEKGMTLSALLDRRSTLPERELQRILLPILDGLELVHNAGFIHRDIKPDNIHIDADGNPVLLDFGSARQSVDSAHTLTILIAPGYAPFEQYYSDRTNQGPWTDIYALGATCYRAIAGRPPMDAVSRSKGVLGSAHEMMVSASVIGAGRYSAPFLAAVDHALEFAEKDRPQSIGEWRRELIVGHTRPAAVTERSPALPSPETPTTVARDTADPAMRRTTGDERRMTSDPPAQPRDAGERRRASAAGPLLGAFAGALIVAVGVGAYVAFTQRSEPPVPTPPQRQDTDRANAERAAKQKADDDAQTKAQDAQRAAELATNAVPASANKPEIVAKSPPEEKKPRELPSIKPPAKEDAKIKPPAPTVVRSPPPASAPPIASSPAPRDATTAPVAGARACANAGKHARGRQACGAPDSRRPDCQRGSQDRRESRHRVVGHPEAARRWWRQECPVAPRQCVLRGAGRQARLHCGGGLVQESSAAVRHRRGKEACSHVRERGGRGPRQQPRLLLVWHGRAPRICGRQAGGGKGGRVTAAGRAPAGRSDDRPQRLHGEGAMSSLREGATVAIAASGGIARRGRVAAWLVAALVLAGCVSQDTKREAIDDINAAFKAEYEANLSKDGRRVVNASPGSAFDATNATLVSLGMVIKRQVRELGYIQAEAPAPLPLTGAEWDRATAVDLPKAREILRRHLGMLAELFNFDPKGVDTIITATISEERGGAEVSLTMRLREVAPPTSDLPRRDYPPPTALKVGLEKIWGKLEQELRASPRKS